MPAELELGVVAPEAEQELHRRRPLRIVDAPGDTEVDQREVALLVDEHVARVEVTVEHAVRDRVLEDAGDREAQEALAVDPVRVRLERRRVRDAWHPRHHEHVLGAQVRDRPRERGEVVAGVLRRDRQLDLVERLEAEVDLLEHQLREQLDEAAEVRDTGGLRRSLGGRGGERHGA